MVVEFTTKMKVPFKGFRRKKIKLQNGEEKGK